MEKGKPILLKDVPKDVYDILIDEQAKIRKQGSKMYSLQSTVYKIIRDFNNGKKELLVTRNTH